MSFHTSVSFYIVREKSYSVEVRGWSRSDTEWSWNVYAHVFDNNPLFNDDEKLKDAPLHGGCTFDQEKITQPIGGPRYDFQSINKTKSVGSDYMHLYSPNLSGFNPFGGIPWQVKKDATDLAEWLAEKSKQLHQPDLFEETK